MSATELKIRIVGDPILRKKAKKIARVNPEHSGILSQMARRMYESKGVGLAAPQVGLSCRMIVVDIGSGLYKLVNPRIVSKSGRQSFEEGCLSVPGIYIMVKRARKVCVEALDENGDPLKIEAQDLLACVFQHEIDHLDGKLIVDYASLLKKIALKKKLANLANEKLLQSEDKRSKL
ncbi:MAG: peptide deformylase [Candidatus Omnitrophica bacterium]|nr:peptide deformylase [Candidatus Omnitrophota bacterium]